MTENRGFEDDVNPDDAGSRSRGPGGEPVEGARDQNSSTGTTPNDEFVGRGSGDDGGFEGETGAEARAADNQT